MVIFVSAILDPPIWISLNSSPSFSEQEVKPIDLKKFI